MVTEKDKTQGPLKNISPDVVWGEKEGGLDFHGSKTVCDTPEEETREIQ